MDVRGVGRRAFLYGAPAAAGAAVFAREQVPVDVTGQSFMVAAYGAVGDGVTDDAPAIQAAVDAAAAAGGGEVRLGRGIHLVGGTITLPVDKPIALRGEGIVHVGGAMGTSLRRGFGYTGNVIRGVGTGLDGSQRIHVQISDMEIHGGDLGGTVVHLEKVNTSILRNLRITSAAGPLLFAGQWWNSWLDKVFFTNGGSGTGAPASRITNDSNTVHITDCEWEGNAGTDLRVEGIAILIVNPKLERDAGNFPLIAIGDGGAIQIANGFLHLGPAATGTHVVQTGYQIPSRPNGIANTEISGNKWVAGAPGGDAVVPYFVDVTAGEMLLTNVSMNGNPTTAFVRIGSGVGANSVRLNNITVTDRSKLLRDERPGSLYGYGSIPLVPAILSPNVTVESSVNRVIWKLPNGATNRITYCNVPIPSDAANNRPVRVRFLWYCDTSTGAIRYLVGARALSLSGDDITVGQSDFAGTVGVPATANRTVTTTVTTTVNVAPGTRFLAVLLQRIGADGADTCTGDLRILGAELLYERAL